MSEVLIVDKDEHFMEELSNSLEEKEINTITCSSLREALDLETETLPLVIVLDARVLLIDGLKLLEKIKSHPETARIYVIVLSTQEDNDLMMKAYELGADEFFVKTRDMAALIHRVGIARKFQTKLKGLAQENYKLLKKVTALSDAAAKEKKAEAEA